MPWLRAGDAARALGVTTSTLRERARAGKIQRRIIDYHTSMYLVGEDDGAPLPAARPSAPRPQSPVPESHKQNDEEGEWHDYYFDGERDKYVFSLRSKGGRAFAIAGDTVRAAVAAYSRDGSDATINEVSRVNGWNRRTTIEILKALGKTHDSAPFTDEEIRERPEDELADDLLRRKEERIIRRAERADWERTKKLADDARHIDRFLLRRVEEIIAAGDWAPPAQASIHESPKLTDTATSCVFGLTDAHIGAHAWAAETGEDNNLDIVRERTLATTRRLVERVLAFRRPSRWLLPSGSDNIHADTYAKTTTKGTPLDTDGSRARMYLAACSLYEEIVSMLLAVAPVDIVTMPGNHDHDTTVMLTHWLAARFRDDQFVKVGTPTAQRSYRLVGNTLVCFAHGDAIKREKLPMVMAAEQSHWWGMAKHRVAFSGHFHSDIVHEYAGTRVIHMPTLARADRWHHENGFIGQTKAIAAYLIDHEEGLVASLPVQPPSEP